MASVIDSDRFRGRVAASQGAGGNGGGTVDDILKRLGVVESVIGEMRADVSAIKAVMPHLATKVDVGALRGEVAAVQGALKADINALETKIIKWIIGTVITSASLAFAIARFVT